MDAKKRNLAIAEGDAPESKKAHREKEQLEATKSLKLHRVTLLKKMVEKRKQGKKGQ